MASILDMIGGIDNFTRKTGSMLDKSTGLRGLIGPEAAGVISKLSALQTLPPVDNRPSSTMPGILPPFAPTVNVGLGTAAPLRFRRKRVF